MESIENKILVSLKKSGRGVAFTPTRFAHYGSASAVQKAIERLNENGHIIRVARGVYCYPKIETELGLGVIYPTFDEIAACLANRDRTLIAPAGAYAVNKLGLSTQVPMNAVYVTNGEGRKVDDGFDDAGDEAHRRPRGNAPGDAHEQLLHRRL